MMSQIEIVLYEWELLNQYWKERDSLGYSQNSAQQQIVRSYRERNSHRYQKKPLTTRYRPAKAHYRYLNTFWHTVNRVLEHTSDARR